jgi:hypothetical protein
MWETRDSHVALYAANKPLDYGEKLGIGNQLWEGHSKTQIMIVKQVNAEGVTVEYTWAGDIKG